MLIGAYDGAKVLATRRARLDALLAPFRNRPPRIDPSASPGPVGRPVSACRRTRDWRRWRAWAAANLPQPCGRCGGDHRTGRGVPRRPYHRPKRGGYQHPRQSPLSNTAMQSERGASSWRGRRSNGGGRWQPRRRRRGGAARRTTGQVSPRRSSDPASSNQAISRGGQWVSCQHPTGRIGVPRRSGCRRKRWQSEH